MIEIFLSLTLMAPGQPPKQELLGPYSTRTLCLLVTEMRTELWFQKHPENSGVVARCGTKVELDLEVI